MTTASVESGRLNSAAVAALAAVAFTVLIGGTMYGELYASVWAISGLVGGGLLFVYVRNAPTQADLVDRWLLLALLLFAASAVLSGFLRQSFDSLLLVFAYVAALFVGRGLMAQEAARSALMKVFMGLSATLTILTAARWFSTFFAWWAATGWTAPAPLDLTYVAQPWGHRYDLALALVLLYPAWWIGRPSPLRRALATVIGVMTAAIVVMIGFRALWLGLAVAAVVAVLPLARPALRDSRIRRALLVACGALAVLIIVAPGVLEGLVARVLTLNTLESRLAMWNPMIELWLSRPIAGLGPGSFPWMLQLTGYFDTNSWAGRHPDSSVVQLVAESGLLGIAAGVVTVVAILPAFRRSAWVRWLLIVFAVSLVAASPTEFPFMMVILIGWVAYALPRPPQQVARESSHRLLQRASFAALAVVALAFTATWAAAMSYERARGAMGAGDLTSAAELLDTAIRLDPSLVLYERQRAVVDLMKDDATAAIARLDRVVQTNPSDDLAWRALGIAYEEAGQQADAGRAFSEAVDVQRSDATNLLLLAEWESQRGNVGRATTLLAETVQAWPMIVGAPWWSASLPTGVTTSDVVDLAFERWAAGLPAPERQMQQGLWLTVFADRADMVPYAISSSRTSERWARATMSLLQCRAIDDLLAQATQGDISTLPYWMLRLQASSLAGLPSEAIRALDMIQLMTGDFGYRLEESALNPLNENGSTSADLWGYRRVPIVWPPGESRLPSSHAGSIRWLLDPVAAVESSGLLARLPSCTAHLA